MSAPAPWLVPARTPVPRDRFNIVAALTGTTLGVVVLVAVAAGGLTPPPTMGAAFLVACPLMGVVALVVLAGRGRDSRDPGLLWAAAGLVVAVVAMTLQACAFVVFSDDGGPLRTTSDGRALLFLILHLTVYGAAFAAWRRWGAGARAGFVVVGLLLLVAVAGGRGVFDRGILFDGATQPLFTVLQGITVVIGVLALVAWVASQPRTSGLHGWVAVAMMLSVCSLLLNMLAVRRFDPAWWASTVLRTALFAALALGVVVEVLRSTRRLETYADIELTRRESELRDSLGLTQTLLDGARTLGRATTTEQVAAAVADLVCEVGDVDLVVVVNDDPEVGRLRVEARRGLSDDVDDAEFTDRDSPLAAAGCDVLDTGIPEFVSTSSAWIRRFGDVGLPSLPGGPWAAVALLPLRVGEVSLGFIAAGSTRPRGWNDRARDVLYAVAAQSAPAMSRARLYDRERRTALVLERDLLPAELPSRPDIVLAALMRPGAPQTRVGGDWYDVLEIDDRRMVIVIGDVMGKGIHAAAVMGRLRQSVRVLVSVDPSPAAVVAGLDSVAAEVLDGRFATMTCALLDTAAGTVSITRAGHPPPVLREPGRPARLIEDAGSPPLGVGDEARPQATLLLAPGSLLALYTDGLVEDRHRGLHFDDLLRAVDELPAGPADDPTAAALAVMAATVRGQSADDVALLIASLPDPAVRPLNGRPQDARRPRFDPAPPG